MTFSPRRPSVGHDQKSARRWEFLFRLPPPVGALNFAWMSDVLNLASFDHRRPQACRPSVIRSVKTVDAAAGSLLSGPAA